MMDENYFSIKFSDGKLIFLDQTKLPLNETYVETDNYNRVAEAIERLEMRGAPLIGVAACYGLALALKHSNKDTSIDNFNKAYERLARTRPTAVNLFNALGEVKEVFEKNKDSDNIYEIILNKAKDFHNDDIEKCRRIGENGSKIFKKRSNVLTHCNTGKLATAGDGTAFSVIKRAYELGLVEHVYADETRPLLQGLRLTSYELERSGIPFTIQSDSTAAVLMQKGKVDLVITGADRIALNGDCANKIGTFNLAVLCNYHNIPFYIAAPSTTIDRNITTGSEIEIEYRHQEELLSINGNRIAPENYRAYTPAFDVTPSHLISGIITEEGVYGFPYNLLVNVT